MIIMKKRISFFLTLAVILISLTSCASLQNWGMTDPPIVKIEVLNFMAHTGIGMTTAVYFSVTNMTDEELTDLTLELSLNPSGGVEVPFKSMVIEKIPPRGSWKPPETFRVRGRKPGMNSVYFFVKKDGQVIAKDYVLVEVPFDDDTYPWYR